MQHKNALSVTSNNIANAQTVGYKKTKKQCLMIYYITIRLVQKGDGKYAGTNPKKYW